MRIQSKNVNCKTKGSVLLAVAIATISLCTSCQHHLADPLRRYEFSQPQMGVPFRIVLYADSLPTANAAAKAAFERIEQLNNSLSDYELETELSQLSRSSGSNKKIPVEDDLWFLLDRSQMLAEQTGGAFDITIGPIVKLWRKARRERKFPTEERLSRARRSVGYQYLQLFPKTREVLLKVPDMRLDLGGIAKGYAVDAALKVLEMHGITQALVSGGGDFAVSAAPPEQKAWRIEIAPIDLANAPPSRTIHISHSGLATSGDIFQRLEINGTRYSHIVNPKTGIGLTHHALVTVIAPDCTTADSLATTLSVLGPEKGLSFVEQIPLVEAQVVYPEGDVITLRSSQGFTDYLRVVHP